MVSPSYKLVYKPHELVRYIYHKPYNSATCSETERYLQSPNLYVLYIYIYVYIYIYIFTCKNGVCVCVLIYIYIYIYI